MELNQVLLASELPSDRCRQRAHHVLTSRPLGGWDYNPDIEQRVYL
jgi:hypothetical protein